MPEKSSGCKRVIQLLLYLDGKALEGGTVSLEERAEPSHGCFWPKRGPPLHTPHAAPGLQPHPRGVRGPVYTHTLAPLVCVPLRCVPILGHLLILTTNPHIRGFTSLFLDH